MVAKSLAPLSYCLWLIKRRLRSRGELAEALQRRGVALEERESVLNELAAVGLIDDRRFAAAWIQGRDIFSPRGEYLLRQELRQKGVADDVVNDILAERREEMADGTNERPDEESLVRELIRRKERLYANLTPEVRRHRLLGYLQRRGFSYELVRRILDS